MMSRAAASSTSQTGAPGRQPERPVVVVSSMWAALPTRRPHGPPNLRVPGEERDHGEYHDRRPRANQDHHRTEHQQPGGAPIDATSAGWASQIAASTAPTRIEDSREPGVARVPRQDPPSQRPAAVIPSSRPPHESTVGIPASPRSLHSRHADRHRHRPRGPPRPARISPSRTSRPIAPTRRDPRARRQVQALDTAGVEPTAHPLGMTNTFRPTRFVRPSTATRCWPRPRQRGRVLRRAARARSGLTRGR
jgi:hypothetical protein